MWKTLRSVILDKRLIIVGLLLLGLVSVHSVVRSRLPPVLSELDTLEHFLFGFVLSDLASRSANSLGFQKLLEKRLSRYSPSKVDLLIRLSGFLIIGGLLWELTELLVFPLFGTKPDPFFSFPITLQNIDGTIDVTVGIIGCVLAWRLAK
jgi:hypothetical protein